MAVTGAPDIAEAFESDLDHLQHHRDVETAVNGAGGGVSPETVYEALLPLGKIDATGSGSAPALFNPANAAWDDGGWLGVNLDETDEGTFADADIKTGFGLHFGRDDDAVVNLGVLAGGKAGHMTIIAPGQINGHDVQMVAWSEPSFSWSWFDVSDNPESYAKVYVHGDSAQSTPLLELQANAVNVFEVTGDHKIGFFGAAPHAQEAFVAPAAITPEQIGQFLIDFGLMAAS